MALVAMVTVLAAWGAFAFGAVYPWAHRPLALAALVVGVMGLDFGRRRLSAYRLLFASLAAIAGVALLQLLPLSQHVLSIVSPATDRFLRNYDLRYAVGLVSGPDDTPLVVAARHAISLDPISTLQAVGLFGAFAVLLAGLLRALSRDSVLSIARSLVWISAALALAGIVQKLVLGDDVYGGMKIFGFWTPQNRLVTPFGPFVNRNHFAGWVLMALPVTLGLILGALDQQRAQIAPGLRGGLLWLSTKAGGQSLLCAIAALLMALALVMTESRSGLLGLGLLLIVTAIWAGRRLGSRGPRLAIGVLVSCLAFAPLLWADGHTAVERLAGEPSPLRLRLDIWRVAWAIVRDFPIFGTGLDTFRIATIQYQPPGPLHYQEAHNDYLQLLAEGGLLMGVAAGLAALAAIRGIGRRFSQQEDRPVNYWVRAGATIGLVAIAAQSLVEFSLQMPGNALLFTVLVALALHSPARPRTTHHT